MCYNPPIMSESNQTTYVLGTDQDELDRLRHQNDVWRKLTYEAWQKAGIGPGSKVMDIGAGPGFVTSDLRSIVGPTGHVWALERSQNFTQHLKQLVGQNHWDNVSVISVDLMTDPLPDAQADFVWCRWVSIFLSNPEILVQKLHKALKPGGKVIFFEYLAYDTWRMIPDLPAIKDFLDRVQSSWRAHGGDPNVAAKLLQYLTKTGFNIESAKPHVFAPTPKDPFFSWLTAFMRVNTARSLASKEVTPAWASAFLHSIESAERDPNRVMITPTVLEIIAVK